MFPLPPAAPPQLPGPRQAPHFARCSQGLGTRLTPRWGRRRHRGCIGALHRRTHPRCIRIDMCMFVICFLTLYSCPIGHGAGTAVKHVPPAQGGSYAGLGRPGPGRTAGSGAAEGRERPLPAPPPPQHCEKGLGLGVGRFRPTSQHRRSPPPRPVGAGPGRGPAEQGRPRGGGRGKRRLRGQPGPGGVGPAAARARGTLCLPGARAGPAGLCRG